MEKIKNNKMVVPRIELGLSDSESEVLPLHHTTSEESVINGTCLVFSCFIFKPSRCLLLEEKALSL